MTTIIRVKRRLQDNPVEAVRLECKRRRTEEAGDSPSFQKVLKFVGTVEKKDDCVAQRTLAISSIYQRRVARSEHVKSHKPDVLSKMRMENKSRSEKNRFKVISCMRSKQDDDISNGKSDDKKNEVAIVDVSIEKKQNEPAEDEKNNVDDGFVYDIYSAQFENDDFNDIYLDNVIGIEPFTSQTVFDMEYRNPEDYADEVYDPDEDDSNEENNWRNDYPDEEGSDSEEIDVLTCEFDRFGRADACDLSSDEGEESYANYTDQNDKSNYFWYEDGDEDETPGSKYEKYKRRVMKSLNASESFEGDDEDEETF